MAKRGRMKTQARARKRTAKLQAKLAARHARRTGTAQERSRTPRGEEGESLEDVLERILNRRPKTMAPIPALDPTATSTSIFQLAEPADPSIFWNLEDTFPGRE